MAGVTVLRLLIRTPLLAAFASAIPARTGGQAGGRPSAVPDLYWVFYLAAARKFASQSLLDEELSANWPVIQEEFWFEHQVRLPDARPNGDTPNHDAFNRWRRAHILDEPGRLDELRGRLTDVSTPLALAIRRAEGGDKPHPLHDPTLWDLVAVDGTVLNGAADVHLEHELDKNGEVIARHIVGSRASSPATARIHDAVNKNINKPHTPRDGLFNLVAVTKGKATYTRVVLALAMGDAGEGEDPIAMRLLRDLYTRVGTTFPVLLYDGAMKPVYQQDLIAGFGIYCVNPNIARGQGGTPMIPTGSDPDLTPLGVTVRRYGKRRGETKKTYFTPLDTIQHQADGHVHEHHLAADDGAVYEVDRHAITGSKNRAKKLRLLEPARVERLHAEDGQYYLRLTLTGKCSHGGEFDVAYDLRKTPPDKRGRLPWTSVVSNVRVIPTAQADRFAKIYGQRNQIESYFSWLEDAFRHKDRHDSWGAGAQTFDMVGAALLHNTQAWAHLAYRHPREAAELATHLQETFTPKARQAG